MPRPQSTRILARPIPRVHDPPISLFLPAKALLIVTAKGRSYGKENIQDTA
jgi:hypothetical protein